MKSTFTENAPAPAGHYSQAMITGKLVFVSGQLPIHPDSGDIRPSIEEQTRQVLDNLENILADSDSSLAKVVKTTIYISDISLWGKVNEIYALRFRTHKPARAVVPTRELHFGCLIEIEAVAEIT
jgi:2-iminobutanoate/2-iminopropanoate deaminase